MLNFKNTNKDFILNLKHTFYYKKNTERLYPTSKHRDNYSQKSHKAKNF